MIPYVNNNIAYFKEHQKALEYAQTTFKLTGKMMPASEIRVDKAGVLQLQKVGFDISKGGLLNLCGSLGIPNPFATKIPTDLLIHNINRLLEDKGSNMFGVYSTQDDVIVDINEQLKYTQIDSVTLLEHIPADTKNLRIKFDNHVMLIEVGLNELEFMTDVHTHQLGYAIEHYPTLHQATIGQPMVWTLVCSNGAFIGTKGNMIKLRVKSTNVVDANIKAFYAKLKGIYKNVDDITQHFNNLSNINVPVKEGKKVINSLKDFEIPEVESLLFDNKYTKASLNEIFKEDPDALLDFDYYQLYYNVSHIGSNLVQSSISSYKIGRLAGKLLLNSL